MLNSETGNAVMRLWLLLHRVDDVVSLCEDSLFREYGLTAEQWQLLASVKTHGGIVTVGELARIVERTPNSVSMLVDRMVKARLVKRTRDRNDRRVIKVSLTGKGEGLVGPPTPVAWGLIQKILSALSPGERETLAGMLEAVKCQAFGYLHPELDMAEVVRNSHTKDPTIYERMVKYLSLPAPQADAG